MAALLGSYSPNDVSVIVNGLPLEGFADGTFVNVEYNSDAATMVEGADGSPAIAFKRGMRGATVTFTCLQTSLANNYLNALLQTQKIAASGAATSTSHANVGTPLPVAVSAAAMPQQRPPPP